MKNKFKIIALFLLISINSNAQTTGVQKGDKQYDNLAYSNAINTLEKEAKNGVKSVDLFQKLGDSYYFNGKLPEANIWYDKLFALNDGSLDSEYNYRYSQTLKATGNYSKANEYLEKYNTISSKEVRATNYSDQKDYKERINKNSGRYEVKTTNINTKLADYGATLFGNQFLFTSSRDKTDLTSWTGNSCTNLYTAKRADDGGLSSPEKYSNILNSKFNEDTPIFTKDLKTVYFTRNNYNKGKKGNNNNNKTLLKIYKATQNNGNWKNITELPFNSDQYSVAHPALSPDENTLYFASDMPGTLGQSDLYKVRINNDGTYSTPENLGNTINTEGRETFPFITPDNELYFASDGHQGLGGLDIFVSQITYNETFSNVLNIGFPINSPMDDFAFLIDKTTKTGYFSSNREGGKGLDDIYSFTEIKPLECNQNPVGTITDNATGNILSNAKVTLLDQNKNVLQESTTDINGTYSFVLECDKKYYIKAENTDYEANESSFETQSISIKSIPVLPLTKKGSITVEKEKALEIGTDLAKTFELKTIYFDLDKSNIRKDATTELAKIVAIMRLYPTIKIDVRSHTDSRQTTRYNELLSDRRAKSTVQWLVRNGVDKNRLTGKGYGESEPINKCENGVECNEGEHQANRRSEFIVVEK